MKKYTLFMLFCILFQKITFGQNTIHHVEPLNWWVGMKNPNLQLLINGDNIAETKPSINYVGVTIKKISLSDSKNYLFIDLEIAPQTKAGTFTINFKKEGKIVVNYAYSLLSRPQEAGKIKGFNSSDVIYLIVPDRFANGDYTNDVVAGMRENKIDRNFEGGRHGGDIRGIINHLDYIADMGYTAIWTTPMLENDMKSYSYHGYSITNHYKVDPRYGTLEDYKELSTKSKQKGIKLIFDEVLNHTGSNYWWMNDLPFKNWLNYPNKYQPTNHKRTVNMDKYASDYDKDLWEKGWFDSTMPDMNGENPFMQNYLIQNSIWWTETLQLGGIRQDTYGYSNKSLLTKWSCRLLEEYPNFSTVGEEWSVNPLITSYWQKGKKNDDGYESCLTTLMDFPLQDALIYALKQAKKNDWDSPMNKLFEALGNDFIYANPKNIMVMGDNHDMDRIFTQLNNDVNLTKMALAYLLTIRGIPQILYGTEILMDNTGHINSHGIIRSDFPGGWQQDSADAFRAKGLSPAKKDMQVFMKTLLNWRKTNLAIIGGETKHFAPVDEIYVYFRYLKNQKVMVVLNNNKESKTLELNRFKEILPINFMAKEVIHQQKFEVKNSLNLEGNSALILEIIEK
jgi:glycosidase